MKKKFFLFFLILVISSISLANIKSISDIETITFNAKEISNINGKNKEIKYSLKMKMPNKIRKEIYFPEINKGELYIYNGNEKTIFLPMFNQKTSSKVDEKENSIVSFINEIIKLEKTDPEFKKSYYEESVVRLQIRDNLSFFIKKYDVIDGYLLPVHIEFFENNSSVGEVYLNSINLNNNISEDNFRLD